MAVVWYGEEAKARIKNAAAVRVAYAGRAFRDHLRQRLSVPGPAPSAVGEDPHKQSGHGRRNVQVEFDRATVTSRVGTNVLYLFYQEIGTWKMGARPWMSRGIRDFARQIRAILEGAGPTV